MSAGYSWIEPTNGLLLANPGISLLARLCFPGHVFTNLGCSDFPKTFHVFSILEYNSFRRNGWANLHQDGPEPWPWPRHRDLPWAFEIQPYRPLKAEIRDLIKDSVREKAFNRERRKGFLLLTFAVQFDAVVSSHYHRHAFPDIIEIEDT